MLVVFGVINMQALKDINKHTVAELSSWNGEPEWVLEKRLEAWEHFEKAVMPDMRYGLDIRMDIAGLDISGISRIGKSEIDAMGGNGAMIKPLRTAMQENHDIVGKYFMKTADLTNKLSAFHWALWNDGLLIYVPEGKAAGPVQISINSSGNVLENMLIILEPLSSLTLLETLSGSPSFRSGVTEVFCGEGSALKLGSLQNYGEDAYNFSSKKAVASRDSRIDWITLDMGSRRTLSDITTRMAGQGAGSRTVGMFFGDKDQQFNFYVNSTHAAPDTTSDMLTKGAVNDRAKVIYRGLVRIEQNAPRSNGYQSEDTLILSDEAEADPVPNLEIENNDVRCSHGTTVSHVDPDKLFYIMSRGVSELEAKKRIVEGFFEPVIGSIPVKTMEGRIRELICQKVGMIK